MSTACEIRVFLNDGRVQEYMNGEYIGGKVHGVIESTRSSQQAATGLRLASIRVSGSPCTIEAFVRVQPPEARL